MSGTLLEQTRAAHEENERLERLIVRDLLQGPEVVKGHREKLAQAHRVEGMLLTISANCARLRSIYEDGDGARKDEIALMAGQNVFSAFYDKLKDAKDYYRRYPAAPYKNDDEAELIKRVPDVPFSGEEFHGRSLDLNELHRAYLNSPWGNREVDYMAYARTFADFGAISRAHKSTRAYREYVASLLAYLEGFHRRTRPLTDVSKILARTEADFTSRWDDGTVTGWEDRGTVAGVAPGTGGQLTLGPGGQIDLEEFGTVAELEALGGDRLKAGLTALGLKAGGTLRQRAERLLATKGMSAEKLDRKLFAKGAAPAAAPRTPAEAAALRAVALDEVKVVRLRDALQEAVAGTVASFERRAAQTYEELEAEKEAEAELAREAELDADDDEEEAIYNPLRLPMGWDGKPIPYWLYKLHGLNIEYKCEICGNYSYWGRRAFERHFQEVRHQVAMRCLKIPNTKQFFEVTKIDEALALHRALSLRTHESARPDTVEEFEDREGNVYNKRTFLDLQKQGLI